jgi:hypothetical protein
MAPQPCRETGDELAGVQITPLLEAPAAERRVARMRRLGAFIEVDTTPASPAAQRNATRAAGDA